ncbi:MAG: hypothetical protein WD648_09535 [Planctomycetaceae bacterium]
MSRQTVPGPTNGSWADKRFLTPFLFIDGPKLIDAASETIQRQKDNWERTVVLEEAFIEVRARRTLNEFVMSISKLECPYFSEQSADALTNVLRDAYSSFLHVQKLEVVFSQGRQDIAILILEGSKETLFEMYRKAAIKATGCREPESPVASIPGLQCPVATSCAGGVCPADGTIRRDFLIAPIDLLKIPRGCGGSDCT